MMDGMVRMVCGCFFRLVGALRLSVVLHGMGSEGIRFQGNEWIPGSLFEYCFSIGLAARISEHAA